MCKKILLSLLYTVFLIARLSAQEAVAVQEMELESINISEKKWGNKASQLLVIPGFQAEKSWIFSSSGSHLYLSDDPYESFETQPFPDARYPLFLKGVGKKEARYIKNYFAQGAIEKALLHLQKVEEKQPNNIYVLLDLAKMYELIERYDFALSRLDLAVKLSSERKMKIQVLKMKARIHFQLSDFVSLESTLLSILRFMRARNRDHAKAAAKNYKDPKQKLKMQKRAVAAKRELALLRNLIGMTWFRLGKLVRAFDLFESLETNFPGVFLFAFNKLKVFLEKKRYESSLIKLNEMDSNLKRLVEESKSIGLKQVQQGNLNLAEKTAQNREQLEALRALLLTRKGEILYREKLYDQGLVILKKSVTENPGDYPSWYRTALIRIDLQEFDLALVALRKVLQNTNAEQEIHRRALEWVDKILNEQAVQAIQSQDLESKKRDEFFQNLTVEDREEILLLGDYIKIGKKWLKEGKFRKLISYYSDLQAEHSNVLEIFYLQGRAYQEMGEKYQARSMYNRALEIDSSHLPTLVQIAYYLDLEKEFRSAQKLLENLHKREPENPMVKAAWGWHYYQQNFYDQAISSYQEAIDLDPTQAIFHYRIGMAYFRSRLFRFALHKFEDAVQAGYIFSRAYLMQGLSLLRLGEFQRGEQAINKAISFSRDNPRVLRFAKNVRESIRESLQFEMDERQDLPPEIQPYFDFRIREQTRREMNVAVSKIVSGQTMEVIDSLKERLETDSANLELYHLIGVLYLLIDRMDLAQEYFELSLVENPLDFRAMNSLSEIAFRQGKLDECLIYWDKIRQVSALIDYAKPYDDLVREFEKLVEINPQDEWAIYNLGLLRLHTRSEEEALSVLERINSYNRTRSSAYKELLLVQQGQILVKLSYLTGNDEFKKIARGILKEGNYRYMSVLDRYPEGVASLYPLPVEKKSIKGISKEQLEFVKKEKTRKLVVARLDQTYPYMNRARFVPTWNKVDQVVSRKQPKAVKSSYDRFVEKRSSVDQRYIEDSLFVRQEEARERASDRQRNLENAQKKFREALEAVRNGQLANAEKLLLDSISTRVDFSDSYFALLYLYLMEGAYPRMSRLLDLLDAFSEYDNLVRMMKAHIAFHSGDFDPFKLELEKLVRPITFPKNPMGILLEDVYSQTLKRAPKDFETALKLGLLYQVTARFEKAQEVYRQAGSHRGLIPFISESLMCVGVLEQRRFPVQEAVQRMGQFQQVEGKEKWTRLTQSLDQYLLNTRFLAQ